MSDGIIPAGEIVNPPGCLPALSPAVYRHGQVQVLLTVSSDRQQNRGSAAGAQPRRRRPVGKQRLVAHRPP